MLSHVHHFLHIGCWAVGNLFFHCCFWIRCWLVFVWKYAGTSASDRGAYSFTKRHLIKELWRLFCYSHHSLWFRRRSQTRFLWKHALPLQHWIPRSYINRIQFRQLPCMSSIRRRKLFIFLADLLSNQQSTCSLRRFFGFFRCWTLVARLSWPWCSYILEHFLFELELFFCRVILPQTLIECMLCHIF